MNTVDQQVPTEESSKIFAGFEKPTKNFFHMPNSFTDVCAEIDNLAELKLVLYILRHTWGYQEYGEGKSITTDEFMYGRKRQDSSRMDKGTGLSNKSVVDGLARAVKHGYLSVEVDTTDKGRTQKSYAIKMQSNTYVDSTQGNLPENTYVDSTHQLCRSYTPAMKDLHTSYVEFTYRSEKDTKERHLRKTLKKDTRVISASAEPDTSLASFPSSNTENDSSTPTNQLPTPVEKLETSLQPANSTTLSEPAPIAQENALSASVLSESNNSTPTTENASQVAKPQASGNVRIAATSRKPRKPKNALELVPVLPPSRPSAEMPWGVEKCLAWGDYVRKSTLPESTRKDSKSFKAKEAACKMVGRGITENSFLVIFVNWMKSIDLDLNPLANGELKSETWPNYSVDLWVVDEHYEDEARKYQKAKLQGSVSTKKDGQVSAPYLRRYDPSKDDGARIVNIGSTTTSTVPAKIILKREIARQQAEAAAKEAAKVAQQA